jgi:hypothetical protein
MDITLSGEGLKQSITICIGENPTEKEAPIGLKKALMQQMRGPRDKTGVPYMKSSTEPRVG